MLKKLVMVAGAIGLSVPAAAATYVVMPAPGSMSPAQVIVGKGPRGHVFVCDSYADVAAGTCRLHSRGRR